MDAHVVRAGPSVWEICSKRLRTKARRREKHDGKKKCTVPANATTAMGKINPNNQPRGEAMNNFQELVNHCIDSHQHHPVKPSKAFRKWDGETPQSMHPLWCAMTILAETALPEELRIKGYQALLFHDLLEDTRAQLPAELSKDVRTLVLEMTFAGFAEEQVKLWDKSMEVKLLKLYDKVSNLMDGAWMSAEKRAQYTAHTVRLCSEVEAEFGNLTIVKIAKAIL